MKLRVVCCIACLLTIPTTLLADNVRVIIHAALQGYKYLDPPGIDHPVITSTSHNSQQIMTQLEVTNYSTKVVTEVEYGWRIAGAAKCTGHTFPAKWGVVTHKVEIAPGKTAVLTPPEMLTTNEYLHQIIDEADRAGAHAVIVTVGLVKVIYADGSAWHDPDAGPKNMFDGGIAETVEKCSATPSTTALAKPKCGGKLKNALFDNALDQCWPTPARGCTGRQIINGDCPFEDCVIVGCGYACSLTWTECWGSLWPLNCNTVGQ